MWMLCLLERQWNQIPPSTFRKGLLPRTREENGGPVGGLRQKRKGALDWLLGVCG
jgi:hypothetical protein